MLKILVISTWFVVWLVNWLRFSWIIVGFSILTKLLAYGFYLEDISPSLIFVIQKHPNFTESLPGKLQSFSGDMCALREPLGDVMRELFYYYYLLWSFFCTFFRINFSKKLYYFCILAEENQEVFSERCSIISRVLQGLVKMCKIYMEVNQFLLVSCSTRIL